MDQTYKRQIAQWARQYQIAVIEDDICADLFFADPQPRPIASYEHDGWVMLVSSISKVIGDSERSGWCAPGRFRDAYMTHAAISQISSPYYRQKALALYLDGSRYPAQLRQWRQLTRSSMQQALQVLTDTLDQQIKITQPSGGYLIWLKLPDHINANRLRQQANQQQVDFLPGELFSLQARFLNYLRLVIIPPFSGEHQHSIEVLGQLINYQTSLAASPINNTPQTRSTQ